MGKKPYDLPVRGIKTISKTVYSCQKGHSEVKIPTFMIQKEKPFCIKLNRIFICILMIKICTVSWNQTRRKRNPRRLSDPTILLQLGDCETHNMDRTLTGDKFIHQLNRSLLNTYYLLGTALMPWI